ncbi:MAG: hypothetical protein U9N34_07670 [Candidatus Cloacimonadota bacterium]|nr:hypothetical protein [Candidatus Cloacimonadota bacterium]
MNRKLIKKENAKKIGESTIGSIIEIYQDCNAALEINDGLPHTAVWEKEA